MIPCSPSWFFFLKPAHFDSSQLKAQGEKKRQPCSRHWYFYEIPKVKFLTSMLFSLGYVLILGAQLLFSPPRGVHQAQGFEGPWMSWAAHSSWMYQSGHLDGDKISPLEILNWFWTICRLYEEFLQMFGPGASLSKYFSSVYNGVEVASYLMIITVLHARPTLARAPLPSPPPRDR